ncbi:hypothetical protein [uncultured Nostoc sp.]|nr:hypothetical protein [uncultured Nostoc sp.]
MQQSIVLFLAEPQAVVSKLEPKASAKNKRFFSKKRQEEYFSDVSLSSY